MPLSAGDRLGPYEILTPIGAGGMGEVYKALDTRLGRTVAIKTLNSGHMQRFEREARAIAALNHPHICTLHDVGPDYLVMEFIEGAPIEGPLPVEEAVRLALQIVGALELAHGKGVIHRDLKPGNILVTASGVKLLDFGLAKITSAPADDTLSIEGTVMGTPAYMAPEQAHGRPLDERSDVFSFGSVLYELLSGNRAFSGSSMADVLSAVIRDDPATLRAPEALARVVSRCLRKAPADRFQSMAEVRAALEQISAKPVERQPSIAVLPFADMSPGKDHEYFSDGLSEEIINALAHVPGLKVTARTSAFAFRGKEQDIRKVAEALDVETILEGSVRRAGNRIRVTAQLINAADGYHLWSERYDRELADVFAVQDEIATAIVGALKLKLVTEAPRHYTPKLPAYEAFLKGRHHFLKYTAEALARSKEYFEQAIRLDGGYADPHMALASSYLHLAVEGLRPASEVMPLVREETARARDLDPSEPRAHALLGAVACLYDYDWNAAAEQFQVAMTGGSELPGVRQCYVSFYLLPLGRFPEAVEELERELKQDPLNVAYRAFQAGHLSWAGLYERGIEEARAALEIENHWLPHYVMAENYAERGMLTEALAAAESARQLAPWNARVAGVLAAILTRTGNGSRAEELRRQSEDSAPIGMVVYHMLRSELDAAADWYEKSIEQREPFAVMYARTAFAAPLRASARWPSLAKMMNLPTAS
jgi:eukaryotic-like serine/threonine-protein kinase